MSKLFTLVVVSLLVLFGAVARAGEIAAHPGCGRDVASLKAQARRLWGTFEMRMLQQAKSEEAAKALRSVSVDDAGNALIGFANYLEEADGEIRAGQLCHATQLLDEAEYLGNDFDRRIEENNTLLAKAAAFRRAMRIFSLR